jgi:potassium-transporting ATPase KdpC subunit
VNVLLASLRMLLVLTLVTGVIYPLFVTAVARVAFPRQAAGSLIERDGKVVGSALLGQPFGSPRYFWGRLSATAPAYNGAASSGSNLGQLNPALVEAASGRIAALRAADPTITTVPVDLATASGSGLDPHISVAAAEVQVRRVAAARGIPEPRLRGLVRRHTEPRTLGLLGEPVVNVLELNLALEQEVPR